MNSSSVMRRPPGRRRRYSPLVLAIGLALLTWIVIAVGGAVLGAWLA